MCRAAPLLPLVLLLGLTAASAVGQAPDRSLTGQRIPCTGGEAGGFACRDVDLLAFLAIPDLGGDARVRVNDLWGWTDPETGKEYTLVGRSDGTAFVDISDPVRPRYLGFLPTHTNSSLWRDIKVYRDHAYIVADAAGSHGLQVFDLTQLRSITQPPDSLAETAHYDGFGSAHNLFIHEETGYAYVVGIQGWQPVPPDYPNEGLRRCGPGLHIVSLQEPADPRFAGCFIDEATGGRVAAGYTHDVQCVLYHGPDPDYQGREICVGSNELWISIADLTDKTDPAVIARATYPTAAYVHQGWLTEDHRYFFQDDELDECERGLERTRTIIWDLTDLDEPVVLAEYFGVATSIDHNQYVVGSYAFQANYTSGLRILDVSDVANPTEIGFFDTFPASDAACDPSSGRGVYEGAWSTYPFFESGVVIVSSIGEGLFVLAPTTIRVDAEGPGMPRPFRLSSPYPNPFGTQAAFSVDVDVAQQVVITVYNALGQPVALLHHGLLTEGTHHFDLDAAGWADGLYFIHASGARSSSVVPVTRAR